MSRLGKMLSQKQNHIPKLEREGRVRKCVCFWVTWRYTLKLGASEHHHLAVTSREDVLQGPLPH